MCDCHLRQLRGARGAAHGAAAAGSAGCQRSRWPPPASRHRRPLRGPECPLLLGAGEADGRPAHHAVERLAKCDRVARERRVRRQRQIDAEHADEVRGLFLVTEVAPCCLHGQTPRLRGEAIEHERGDSRPGQRAGGDAVAAVAPRRGWQRRAGAPDGSSKLRVNDPMVCGTPSSIISKSASDRSRTGCPRRSRTTTSTRTARTPASTVPGARCGAWGVWPAGAVAASRATIARVTVGSPVRGAR